MKFLDSNIIAYAFYQNEHQIECQKIIKEGGIINTLNLIEAANIIEHETNDRNYTVSAIKSLLKSDLKIVDVDLNIIFETLKRASKYQRLKFIDLVHYIVALLNNCESIISYDRDFDGLEIPRI